MFKISDDGNVIEVTKVNTSSQVAIIEMLVGMEKQVNKTETDTKRIYQWQKFNLDTGTYEDDTTNTTSIIDNGQSYTPVNGQVVVDKLPEVKATKIAQLEAAEMTYLQTFASNALGTVHTYLSDLKGMTILNGQYAYIKSADYKGELLPYYTVEEGLVDHTAAQFTQVWLDGMAKVKAASVKLDGLIKQVMAATTVAQVNAINW